MYTANREVFDNSKAIELKLSEMDNIDFREKKMAMAHMYYLNYLFSIELSMFNRVDNFNFPNGY